MSLSCKAFFIQKQPPEVFLEILQNSQQNACARVCFLIKFIKKETLEKVFSSEFCEISKNTFFTEHLRTTASIHSFFRDQCCWSCLNTLKCFWKYNESKTKHPFLIKNSDMAEKVHWWSKRRIYYCEPWRRLYRWGLKEDPVT